MKKRGKAHARTVREQGKKRGRSCARARKRKRYREGQRDRARKKGDTRTRETLRVSKLRWEGKVGRGCKYM